MTKRTVAYRLELRLLEEVERPEGSLILASAVHFETDLNTAQLMFERKARDMELTKCPTPRYSHLQIWPALDPDYMRKGKR